MSRKSPHEHDVAIGRAVRAVRQQAGLSQEKLADRLGITFQQVQKYEKGTNRIAGSRLMAIAAILGVSVGELVGERQDSPLAELAGLDPETSQLVRIARGLADADRTRLVQLARVFERTAP